MKLPTLSMDARNTDVTTEFGGYNHNISISEGEFYDMHNMTSEFYPALSPRRNRGEVKKFENLQGILDREDLVWIDDGKLYVNGEEKSLSVPLSKLGKKQMAKMGAEIMILPDKVYYNVENGESGYIEAHAWNWSVSNPNRGSITFIPNKGKTYAPISPQSSAYYESNPPKDGDYKCDIDKISQEVEIAGHKVSIDVGNNAPIYRYSSSSKSWMVDAECRMAMIVNGDVDLSGFSEGDGIRITILGGTWANANYSYTFFNTSDEITLTYPEGTKVKWDKGLARTLYTTVASVNYGSVLVLNSPFTFPIDILSGALVFIERYCPDMSYVTEFNNRIWGCSTDGHEVYACKLGDMRNWQAYAGISTDSWAATVGSDGIFTGAITYGGYPMFFKEHSMLKISPSATGAHAYREVMMNGVQEGSANSLCEVNGVLIYKGVTGVYAYTSTTPTCISDALGDKSYTEGHAGTIDNRYYICLTDREGVHNTFMYDLKKGMWTKEDSSIKELFCRHKDELYFYNMFTKTLESVSGKGLFGHDAELEEDFDWYAESGNIGYLDPNNKALIRLSIRIALEQDTEVNVYLQYDSSERWEYVFHMAGTGIKTFTLPIKPHRCDHFKYKIAGHGQCKILSVTKTLIVGSDVNAHNY